MSQIPRARSNANGDRESGQRETNRSDSLGSERTARAIAVESVVWPLQARGTARDGGSLEDGGERNVFHLLDEVQAAANYSENFLEEIPTRISAAAAFGSLSQADCEPFDQGRRCMLNTNTSLLANLHCSRRLRWRANGPASAVVYGANRDRSDT